MYEQDRIVANITELVSLTLTEGLFLQDYHNVTAILCAPFNQDFPFFCTIILLISFMGSLR